MIRDALHPWPATFKNLRTESVVPNLSSANRVSSGCVSDGVLEAAQVMNFGPPSDTELSGMTCRLAALVLDRFVVCREKNVSEADPASGFAKIEATTIGAMKTLIPLPSGDESFVRILASSPFLPVNPESLGLP